MDCSTTVTWNGEQISIPTPKTSSKSQCLRNVDIKTHIRSEMNRASTPEQKKALEALQGILHGFVQAQYVNFSHKHKKWTWRPRSLTKDVSGVYSIVYKDDSLKVGMSIQGCITRVGNQEDVKFAALLMDGTEALAAVPAKVMTSIKELRLPSINFHEDKNEYLELLIALQLAEMMFACAHGDIPGTGSVAERLVKLPSERVQSILAAPRFPKRAVDRMREQEIEKYKCALTWAHLPSALRDMAKSSHFLSRRLRPAPPEGGFVTANLLMGLLGPKYGGFEDCVVITPRELRLEDVLAVLKPLTKKPLDESNMSAIQEALSPIQGDDYEHYEPPTDKVLAEGAHELLTILLEYLPDNVAIVIERWTIRALEQYYYDWLWDDILDKSSEIELVPEDKRALSLIQTKAGRPVIITLSFFVAFAEKTTLKARFNSAHGYAVALQFFLKCGIISQERVDRALRLLCSYLMGLGEKPEDEESYRKPRSLMFPNGYFPAAPPRVMLVSKYLKIGYGELLYLREKLGQVDTDKVLKAHGLLKHPNQVTSPLDLNWVCPGAPAVGKFEADPCNHSGQLGEEFEEKTVTLVGGSGDHPGNPYCGYFICTGSGCRRKTQCREIEYLNEMKNADDTSLSKDQVVRLQQLEVYKQDHRDRANNRRDTNIQTEGLEEVQMNESVRNRTSQSKIAKKKRQLQQAESSSSNQVATAAAAASTTTTEEQQQQQPKKKKRSGVNHVDPNTKLNYPEFFVNMLKHALRIWVRECGEDHVFLDYLIALFEKLINQEEENLGFRVLRGPTGRPKYLKNDYRAVYEIYLEPPENENAKDWHIRPEYLITDVNVKKAKLQKRAILDKKKTPGGPDINRIEKNGPFMDYVIGLMRETKT